MSHNQSPEKIRYSGTYGKQLVHNHGPETGPGLACRETRTPAGNLQGDCMAPPVTPARQIVLDFLHKRLAANNARIAFLLDGTPEALTAWCDAENAALGDDYAHDVDLMEVPC